MGSADAKEGPRWVCGEGVGSWVGGGGEMGR